MFALVCLWAVLHFCTDNSFAFSFNVGNLSLTRQLGDVYFKSNWKTITIVKLTGQLVDTFADVRCLSAQIVLHDSCK